MIQLNEKSKIPIYQQVYDGLLRLIIMKVLEEGDKLPSVRELALMLEINPNTIQKAYKGLEADGYITSAKGKGNFVAGYQEVISTFRGDVEERLSGVLKEMILLGQSKENILNTVSIKLEEIK